MTPYYQIPRNSLAWMLVAQLAVVLPHAFRMPFWVLCLCAVCGIWRVLVFKGQLSYPPWYVRGGLIIIGFVGVVLSYGKIFHLQPMVTILIVSFYLKLIEMHKRRDAYVVIFLAYFIIATEFIYDQSIVIALYMFLCVILVTTALIGLTQSQGHKKPWHSFLLTTKLVMQAIPLTLVVFLLFPRIPPLWSVPMGDDSTLTGMSDSMSPGDFSSLSRSSELAFRASFEGKIPDKADLYWRGLVFDYFDGRNWSAKDSDPAKTGNVRWFGQQIPRWEEDVVLKGKKIKYEVMLEPTNQSWLYSLPVAKPTAWGDGIARDFRLLRDSNTSQMYSYKVESFLDYRIDINPKRWLLRRNLQLPDWGNPESRKLAKKLRDEFPNDAVLMRQVLNYFNESFTYTLQPPKLGANSVDEFLFETRSGFCEHFASSFVFLMRAAGVPARVVVGYQGGEVNKYENYLLVHQFDAHAWTEVWLPKVGWVRVDPTAAVAPERVQRGIEEALSREGSFLRDSPFSSVHLRKVPLLGALRLRMDQINYAWVRWVIGYRPQLQRQVLENLLGGFSQLKVAIALLVFCGVGIGFIALSLYFKGIKKKLDPITRYYLQFCERLNAIGLTRDVGEAPGDFTARVISQRPDLAAQVQEIHKLYYYISYQKNAYSESELQIFRDKVRQFKPSHLV